MSENFIVVNRDTGQILGILGILVPPPDRRSNSGLQGQKVPMISYYYDPLFSLTTTSLYFFDLQRMHLTTLYLT